MVLFAMWPASGGQVSLVELQPGSGGLCGGTYVDEQFDRWLESDVFTAREGVPPLKALQTMHAAEFHLIRGAWQVIKHNFEEEDGDQLLKLPVGVRKYVNHE